MSETARDIRRKRLLHRSRYRGVKESDLLFGQFATTWLPLLDDAQLDRYEALLGEPDQDILAWIYGREPVPPQHDNDVFRMLRSFEPSV
ncbi:succinate dehydrogenase assembly factor 2 [Benzoatithermus flavus]|uniref:FAD assembly factor SdhE n=1 Tax=Benzoatithermus flavus TaxID=3108223 RepID=A0ABU8XTR8_9PROT